jgi:WD40 repeat protein
MSTNTTENAVLGDYSIPDQVEDSIQIIRFNPNKNINILASCGWNCKVRVWNISYQVNQQINTTSAAVHVQRQFYPSTIH